MCGRQNAFGEPACTQCGQTFIYNCPICGSHINNQYNKCRGCGTAFNWGTMMQQNQSTAINFPSPESQAFQDNQQQNIDSMVTAPPISQPDSPAEYVPSTVRQPSQPVQSQANTLFSSPKFWIILIIICIVLIAILLIVDRFISK